MPPLLVVDLAATPALGSDFHLSVLILQSQALSGLSHIEPWNLCIVMYLLDLTKISGRMKPCFKPFQSDVVGHIPSWCLE
jgi:hypothetical protein